MDLDGSKWIWDGSGWIWMDLSGWAWSYMDLNRSGRVGATMSAHMGKKRGAHNFAHNLKCLLGKNMFQSTPGLKHHTIQWKNKAWVHTWTEACAEKTFKTRIRDPGDGVFVYSLNLYVYIYKNIYLLKWWSICITLLEYAGRALRGLSSFEIRSRQRPSLKQGWSIAKTMRKTNAQAWNKAGAIKKHKKTQRPSLKQGWGKQKT